jgi:SRSO17 transposase
MPKLPEFERYMSYLCEALGHADRHAGFTDYSRALLLPIERKSVEPLAAHTDPWHVSAKHQSLHHLVAKSEWSDEAVLARVREWVTPKFKLSEGCYWIVDDTGFPKKGKHSVGVTRQYCGQLGKQDNCQVAVSLSLATARGSVPMDWRLYLPKAWASDAQRRHRAGVPPEISFATKPEIALEQIAAAKAQGVPPGVVLADAAYGNDCGFRDALSAMQLNYCVAVQSSTGVWSDGHGPLPPKAKQSKGRGRPAKCLRRDPRHPPRSLKEVAASLPHQAWRTVSWREGSQQTMRSRFAVTRVRVAHRDYQRNTPREEQWLLIEWPRGDTEPLKYWLANLPANMSLTGLVHTAKMRWRIERDYQELKQEFGLNHYEGRGWRGFHHHATLCIAAYGFLMAHRLKGGGKKNAARRKASSLPEDYTPRGGRTSSATRSRFHRDAALSHRYSTRTQSRAMPVLRNAQRCSELMTQ